MRVHARGYNEAARYTAALPPDGDLELTAGSTVENLLETLAVPRRFFTDLVILVNGRPASLNTLLGEGDRLIFFGALAGGSRKERMGFVCIPGLPGKVYVPDPDPEAVKKHPCPDCHCCQNCSPQRCRACRGGQEDRPPACGEPEA